jgi:hypothetical protein
VAANRVLASEAKGRGFDPRQPHHLCPKSLSGLENSGPSTTRHVTLLRKGRAMARYLYRRASGIYAVRICVPERLRVHFSRREIHVFTGTSDPAVAKASAFAILTVWQHRVVELKNMDVVKITEGSSLLTGSGSVRLEDMQKTFSMTRAMLLNEIRNSGADLSCVADGWIGVEVADMREVERDFDGTYLFDDALSKGVPIFLVGEVILSSATLAAQCFAGADIFNECMVWRDAAKRRAF